MSLPFGTFMILDVHFTFKHTFYYLVIKYKMHSHLPTLPKEKGKKGCYIEIHFVCLFGL